MREAVIVSYARTGLAKSVRGGFNETPTETMAAHAIKHAIERSGVEADFVEDSFIGNVGNASTALGRSAALLAGMPVTTGGVTINRFCSSGLQAIAMAANYVVQGGADCVVAGGAESLSYPPARPAKDAPRNMDTRIIEQYPGFYLPMIDTADIVADRYDISREAQDEYSLESQKRTAAAQEAGRFDDEIVPLATKMRLVDKETKEVSYVDKVVDRDECNRPTTTIEGLQKLEPVRGEGKFVTAGNASQLSDGAAAVIIMEAKEAERRGLEPLGAFRGFAVAGCEPDEMGIGPVLAVPRLLERQGLKVDDIDLWELNEAFASQCLYCRDQLGIDPEKYNVNGGSISIGHPYGMTGARLTGHVLQEARRRGNAKLGVVTMCIGFGQGAAALFEAF